MPKLDGIEEKYINGVRCDKENEQVFFNDDTHTYYDKETMETYVSVTQIIHHYTQEFDGDFWAAYKALESILDMETWYPIKKTMLSTKKFNPKIIVKLGIDNDKFLSKKQEILDEYERKKNEACERGTRIHAEFENSFYGKTDFNFDRFDLSGLNGNYTCKKDYYVLDLENGVYPEFLLSVKSKDGSLRVSGQIDFLSKRGNKISILDWKTNASIDRHSYFNKSTKQHQMMKFPLNNLEDCNFNHYQLQLSLYAYMLQTLHPEYEIENLQIVHVDHDGKQHNIPVTYLKDDVIRMLKHYKKEMKIKGEYDKLKPVIV